MSSTLFEWYYHFYRLAEGDNIVGCSGTGPIPVALASLCVAKMAWCKIKKKIGPK